jgi:single stranded DNA-binding protein
VQGLNKCMLLGNLGADPELRMTGGGQAVLKVRLATSEQYLDKDKQRQERTEWHSVIVWGKRGEGVVGGQGRQQALSHRGRCHGGAPSRLRGG